MIARRPHCLRSSVIAGMLVAAALCSVAPALAGEPVTVENAWIPLAPPGLKVHAAYMTVINRSTNDQHIVGASSPGYERIELHRSAVKDGMSSMQTLDEVTVPANGRVEFAPAGLHFMLVGPTRPQAVDDQVQIVLRLRSGEQVGVSAVVRRRDTASPDAHRHH
jgi:copper(I)-binding protein